MTCGRAFSRLFRSKPLFAATHAQHPPSVPHNSKPDSTAQHHMKKMCTQNQLALPHLHYVRNVLMTQRKLWPLYVYQDSTSSNLQPYNCAKERQEEEMGQASFLSPGSGR